jgi:hypothetical protein
MNTVSHGKVCHSSWVMVTVSWNDDIVYDTLNFDQLTLLILSTFSAGSVSLCALLSDRSAY